MKLNIDKTELERKNKIIDDAICKLKEEFIGIDDQIDTVMNNVRVWYLYPQLQVSPCVINIFGMTGCGKTSLIRRIAQLLGVEKNLVYFNFCSINEQSSYQIEEDIENQLDNECSNRIFVYDEFQYAATLDNHGDEKDNKNGLKPFWELLDTGMLHKRCQYWETVDIFRTLNALVKINNVTPMEIVKGVWVNAEECLKYFDTFEKERIMKSFNIVTPHSNIVSDGSKNTEPMPSSNVIGMGYEEDNGITYSDAVNNFFLKENIVARFTTIYNKVKNLILDETDMYHMLEKMNIDEIIDLFIDIYEKSRKGYNLKFNDSLIFVVANLDEAYDMAFDVNPDMSPDQFNEITKKITVVDIKKALQKRFRNEQIARLGNVHVIYPAFSSKSFKKIIDINLKSYADITNKLCGFEIEFENSIKKIIFDEAVYPTHGTRPIFSTIHEIIKTKLPYIIRNIYDDEISEKVAVIRYGHKGKKTIIKVLDKEKNVIKSYKFSDRLSLDKLRESVCDEKQANTAVHESGHFVIYSYLNGKVPEKIVSRSVEKSALGFMMDSETNKSEKVESRTYWLNEIMVCLGGYVAEGLIFGKEMRSAGASRDLELATEFASRMVREWGLTDLPYVTTYLNLSNNNGSLIKEDNQDYINKRIKGIVEDCLNRVIEIMSFPHIWSMLKESSKYLSTHSQMPKTVMEDLLNKAREKGCIKENNERYYRNIVDSL